MDPNENISVVINATDSSVSSLMSSFVQLELNVHNNTAEPINRLPNELMQQIVEKLRLYGDVKTLIRLRLVSTRWKTMAEDYLRLQKSLVLVVCSKEHYAYSQYFEKRFLASANLKNSKRLDFSTKISSECLRSLLKLFSNIVQVSIYCDDLTRVPDFVSYFNSLESLKQLDIYGNIIKSLPSLSRTLLSKLVHIGFADLNDILNEGEFGQIVSRIGPDCVRFHLAGKQSSNPYYSQLVQWQSINPTWLANLTDLQIGFESACEVHSQVVHHLCERAISIKHFKVNFHYNSFDFTPVVICRLGKLIHLVELNLWNIVINICEEANAPYEANARSSLLVCKLYQINESSSVLDEPRPINADHFTRIMSATFPNLAELELAFDFEWHYSNFVQLKHGIEHNLHRFQKLCKHKVDYHSYDDD